MAKHNFKKGDYVIVNYTQAPHNIYKVTKTKQKTEYGTRRRPVRRIFVYIKGDGYTGRFLSSFLRHARKSDFDIVISHYKKGLARLNKSKLEHIKRTANR